MLVLTKPWGLVKSRCTILPSLSEPFHCCRGQAKAQRWRFAVQMRWLLPSEVKPQQDSSPGQMEKATAAWAVFCWSAKHPHAEKVLFTRANEFCVRSKQVHLKIKPSWSMAIHHWASPCIPSWEILKLRVPRLWHWWRHPAPKAPSFFFFFFNPEEMQINLTLSSYSPAWSKRIREVVSSKM